MKVKGIIKLPNGNEYEEIIEIEDYPEPTKDEIFDYVYSYMEQRIRIRWEEIKQTKNAA